MDKKEAKTILGAKMKHFILYSHDGSGNHGCEALVRTTSELLKNKKNRIILSSTHPEEDFRYGIQDLCEIHLLHEKSKVSKFSINFLKAYYAIKKHGDYFQMDCLSECAAFSARKGDVALSIGGDSYCYGGTEEMAFRNRIWKQCGLKTVYWGCSIEPNLLENPEIANDIASFDLITARESISYEALNRINPKTVLVSDSAFLLQTKKISLPDGLEEKSIVGLNLSPLAENLEEVKGITRTNFENLIEYILSNTDYCILLIPHVIWEGTDDRTINDYFFNKYKESGRVFAVEDASCEVLKGYISKCRFFIGARTHATIAAYSSNVPTVVLGYSVKSKGIAKDLFGSYEKYVLPVQSLKASDDLVNAFKWLRKSENMIKNRLRIVLPEYTKRVYKGLHLVKNL